MSTQAAVSQAADIERMAKPADARHVINNVVSQTDLGWHDIHAANGALIGRRRIISYHTADGQTVDIVIFMDASVL